MKIMKPLLSGVAAIGATGVVFVVLGSVGVAAAGTSASGPVLADHPLTITIYPGGRRGERVMNENFAVQPGVRSEFIVVNYTRRMHTITIPGLRASYLVRAGGRIAPTKTRFSFVASKYGVFRWYCALPCGSQMSGYVYAIIGENA
jgi:hypothetical protein